MLRRLAQWRGSRIALLCVTLLFVEGFLGLSINRLSDNRARHAAGSMGSLGYGALGALPLPDGDSGRIEVRADSRPDGGRAREDSGPAVGFQSLIDSIAAPLWGSLSDTVLSPEFFLLLGAMAVFFYGIPLALVVLTVLWLVARWRYGRPTNDAPLPQCDA